MANTTKFQEGIVVESYRNDSIDISLLTSAKDQDEITDLVSRGIVNRQKGAETKLFITKKGKELAKDLLHVKQHKLNVFRPIEPPQ
jgi:DNA-binding MarR family transcriptional regulator